MSEITIAPNVLDINLYNRDSINIDLVLKTSANNYVSLPQGATSILWKSQIRNSSGSVATSFTLTPSSTDLTNGALNMYLAPTNLLSYTGLVYDLQVSYISSGASFTNTYLKGSIVVTDDVTQ
jgi:hypothetical protein